MMVEEITESMASLAWVRGTRLCRGAHTQAGT